LVRKRGGVGWVSAGRQLCCEVEWQHAISSGFLLVRAHLYFVSVADADIPLARLRICFGLGFAPHVLLTVVRGYGAFDCGDRAGLLLWQQPGCRGGNHNRIRVKNNNIEAPKMPRTGGCTTPAPAYCLRRSAWSR
jgi:hypothetical protein